MLSIGKVANGQYYLSLAQGEYYVSAGEPPGQWLGKGAATLGLAGTVTDEAFTRLFAGMDPDGLRPLIQNAGKADHQPGWDLTFSAPKPVSAVWSQGDPTACFLIEEAHRQAVRAALAYLEETAALTRRGKGGAVREPAKLIIAAFTHCTSRAHDPQLHSHAVVLNLGVRADGSVGTILSLPIYKHKMAVGAIYRAELAAKLHQQLGLNILVQQTGFQVAGVPDALCAALSTRRRQIEPAMQARALETPRAAAIVALDTRPAKERVPRDVLFARWHGIGQMYGFTDVQVRALLKQEPIRHDTLTEAQEALRAALVEITEHDSNFTERDLTRRLAEQMPILGADAVRQIVSAHVRSSDVVALGKVRDEERFTTPEMLALEADLLDCARRLKGGAHRGLPMWDVQNLLDRLPGLSAEQQTAFRHVAEAPGNIHLISGRAGTGKTVLLTAVRQGFEQAGYTMQGAAISARAAQELEAGSGIPSRTLHRLLLEAETNRTTSGNQHALDAGGSGRLDATTVLVIDEAGMVGTRQMAQVLNAVEESGCRLILIGDGRQLQPIEAGGPFAALGRELGQAELVEIKRQNHAWARDAVACVADGLTAEGLTAFIERGLVQVTKTRPEAMRSLIGDWQREGILRPRDHLILATTNQEVALLNRMAQQTRKQAGELCGLPLSERDAVFYIGDRVQFTHNDRRYGICNGTFGTVLLTDVVARTLTVRLDSGDLLTLPLAQYADVQLGYATTTYKAQGMTAEHVYVLLDETRQDRELTYVQISRARDLTRLYTDRASAGEDLTDLLRQVQTSHRKELAHDLLSAQHPALAPTLSRR